MTEHPEDARVLHLPTGETVTILRSGRDADGVLEIEGLLPPGLAGPPRHRHRAQTETFTVLEGRLRVTVGRETRVLRVGETAVVPPTVVHAFANPFDEPARIRATEEPAGPLEEQFRALARAGRVPPVRELAAINVRHGLPFALAGVPEAVQRPVWRLLARLHRG
ncbi:cupin domain-containing protein [Actinomycetospora lemnae]|uniref:Cupin domain-containing protein n=1 Tax=Actinomycetospora lemnae TaxID=3019891 RepID=A0ABT5SRA0_9PSEU|nr:cupin domain-containing protein [Actinomycetospora sp. DW7H6]MDD7964666.1 cupin domain-containing protein [Actinomycetospora sp. DW7H6]